MGLRPVIVVLLLGSMGFPAAAQQFNLRLDPLGQHEIQSAYSVEVNDDGTILCIGASKWTDSVYYSPVVTSVLLDGAGDPLLEDRWEYVWHLTFPGWSNSSSDAGSSFYCLGGGSSDSTGTNRAALLLMAANGDQQWLIEHGFGSEFWAGDQAKALPSGGFVLCGRRAIGADSDAFILVTDSAGAAMWTEFYGGQFIDECVAVDLTLGGGYYIGGRYGSANFIGQLWVIRTDTVGTVLWERLWGSPYDEPNAHLITASDGHVLVASAYGANSDEDAWPYLAKLDSTDGSTIWEHTYGNAAYNTTFFAVKELAQGDLIAVGQSRQLTNDMYLQGLLVRTNSQGDSLWMRHYYYADSLMTDGLGTLRDVEPTPDGGFVAVGATWSSASGNNPPQYNQDMWVLKVDSMGCLVPGCDGIGMIASQNTNYKEVLSIAPNPAHGTTRVSWVLPPGTPLSGPAQLSVVSASGTVVQVMDVDLSRGGVEVDLRNMSAGLYYLHLVCEGVWVTGGKLMVE